VSGEGLIRAARDFEMLQLCGPVLAVAKPRERRVALFVAGPNGRPGSCEMSEAEAEALHETLGSALQLLKRPGELPVAPGSVPGTGSAPLPAAMPIGRLLAWIIVPSLVTALVAVLLILAVRAIQHE
jgi:hypothetical protein